ncbi:hypothetical protein SRO_3820 [Streptomyces rochei]|nr:hypothetical protein SRO_3820 [Streptomyces rochei]
MPHAHKAHITLDKVDIVNKGLWIWKCSCGSRSLSAYERSVALEMKRVHEKKHVRRARG